MVLIDSSIWIEAFRRDGSQKVREQLSQLIDSGEAAWCPAIRLELWAGVGDERERSILQKFTAVVTDLPIGDEAWNRAITLAETGRRRGRTFPFPDFIIYACAKVHCVELLHQDRHFDLMNELFP